MVSIFQNCQLLEIIQKSEQFEGRLLNVNLPVFVDAFSNPLLTIPSPNQHEKRKIEEEE